MVPLIVKRQTSTMSGNDVDIVRTSDFNRLALTLGFDPVYPESGEGIFIPYSQESLEELGEVSVETRLMESDIDLSIDEVYPHVMFPVNTVNFNSIVVNDSDYAAIDKPLAGFGDGESTFTYYAFDIPDWEETVSVGKELTGIMQQAVVQEDFRDLNFFFVNPGEDYRLFKSSFAILLFIGVMVAAVFLLAAGSFIYFKLYTGLERDRRQYSLLVRLGMTEKELGKIVNRQLMPQFFLPWGVALLHSTFAFISLQVVWDEFAELSILGEMVFVLSGFTIAQILYFFLIRWRYIEHLRAS